MDTKMDMLWNHSCLWGPLLVSCLFTPSFCHHQPKKIRAPLDLGRFVANRLPRLFIRVENHVETTMVPISSPDHYL